MRRRRKQEKLSTAALDPDAQSLLRRLAQGGSIAIDAQGSFRLDEHASGKAGQGKALARRLVEFCLAEDWLQWRGKRLVLSETGRARLRRSDADHDAFQRQHQLRVLGDREIAGARRQVMLNEGESPLGWLKRRKDRNGKPLISEEQYEAGERLRADYWFAHLSPRVTSNWSALAPSEQSRRGAPANAAVLRDEVLAAKERVMRALMAVGPEVSGVLVDICCELKGLEEAEKANGWPQRPGKVVLQIALTRLAKHFGLISENEPARGARRNLRHWGAADYRPSLDTWRKDERRGGEP